MAIIYPIIYNPHEPPHAYVVPAENDYGQIDDVLNGFAFHYKQILTTDMKDCIVRYFVFPNKLWVSIKVPEKEFPFKTKMSFRNFYNDSDTWQTIETDRAHIFLDLEKIYYMKG